MKTFALKQLKQHKQKGEAGRRAYFVPKTKKGLSKRGDGEPVLLMGLRCTVHGESSGSTVGRCTLFLLRSPSFQISFVGVNLQIFLCSCVKEAIKRKGGS